MSTSPPGLGGTNTQHIRWGVPAGGAGQSGYIFAGRSVEVSLDGKPFVLGTFTHKNFPIYAFNPNQFDVDLKVHVTFDGGVLSRDFSFRFHHNETPNNGPSPDDEVDLPSFRSPETIEIGGNEYALVIEGFMQGGKIVTKFKSPENGSNSADIVAKLVPIVKPIQTYYFKVLNPDGSVYGAGCFTYEGEEFPVEIAHIIGGLGRGSKLTKFWYHDPMVGSLGLSELLSLNFQRGVEGEPSRFAINAFTLPGNASGITAGIATLTKPGPVSTHRSKDEEHGNEGRTLVFPVICRPGKKEEVKTEIPLVDLVVVMDSSTSMRPHATGLSNAVSAAIQAAKSSCPSDLKVTYLGIEGKFADSLFRTTIREHLTKLGVAESAMRGRKRGTVASGGAQEDGARAIEDVVNHNDWRPGARRAVFLLGDEALEGGDGFDAEDIAAANKAIEVAKAGEVRVHTYFAKSGSDAKTQKANEAEFARVAAQTGGVSFTSTDTLEGGFQAMLESVICASKEVTPAEDCNCCKECMERRVTTTVRSAGEQMWMENQSNDPITSTLVLEQGKPYRLTMQGTYSVWSGFTGQGYLAMKPEPTPMFPSAKGENKQVGLDPEFVFAWPSGAAFDKSPEPAPRKSVLIEVSLDGGKTWKHPTTKDAFNPEHKYTYELTGEGQALQVRNIDKPIGDNYGRIQITVQSGT
ncbi:MAG TPA: choice-of-anchor K domain-containing protein [Archangium sp.]|nr:choice-of-anchor K domain-containing protein [Archangium sp.]